MIFYYNIIQMYKQFNIDIQERIDKYVIKNRKYYYDEMLDNLKKKLFVKNIFSKILDKDIIYIKSYSDIMSVYANNLLLIENNSTNMLEIAIWKNGSRIKFCMKYETNFLKIDKKILKYFDNVYDKGYRDITSKIKLF